MTANNRPWREVSVLAPAKINLYLDITGKREDGDHAGYHELDSLMVFMDAGDRISVEPAEDLCLVVEGPLAGSIGGNPDDNLVMQAARLLQREKAPGDGAKIHLEKNLPVAAGIGGGSADAAATLWALNDLWELGLDEAALAALALPLGADIPACLSSRPVLVRGIGEELTPLSALPETGIVLINPLQPVSTPAVFKSWSDSMAVPKRAFPQDWSGLEWDEFLGMLSRRRNDLEEPATGLCPEISDCLAELRIQKECGLARMSGSGATCFGLFRDHRNADQAATLLRVANPNWWVMSGKLLQGPAVDSISA